MSLSTVTVGEDDASSVGVNVFVCASTKELELVNKQYNNMTIKQYWITFLHLLDNT